MTKPSFSIVVPIYGVEKYIGRCAEQVEHFVEKAAPLISDIKRQSAQIEL